MKNKFILRLLILVAFSVVLHSCRNDQFPEQETYNKSSEFQLTSKTISLQQSKHQAKLIPELQKAEEHLKKIKSNALGKVIDYGNGVSIDTDQVIYIENGPNYHTYTFNINRENAPENTPVENLVLSPLNDGTYRETLVSYALTPQEKQTLANGGYVDTKGKVTITELAKGTYSPLAKGAGMTSCGWRETYTLMECSDVHYGVPTHNLGNMESWSECRADRPAGVYMTMTYLCEFVGQDDGTVDPWGPGSGGGGGGSGGGGGGTGDTPCDNPGGISTQPQDPHN